MGSPFGGGDVALLKALANLSMSFRKPLGVRSDLWGMMYLRVGSVGWSREIACVREAPLYLLRDGLGYPI